MGRLSENSILSFKNKSYAITADVDVPKAGAEGVIIAQGGNIEWVEPLREGRKGEVLLQLLRPRRHDARGGAADAAGHHQVRLEFKYDGGGIGKGGTITLFMDGSIDRRGAP